MAAPEGECPQYCDRSEQAGSASRQPGIIGMEHWQGRDGEAGSGKSFVEKLVLKDHIQKTFEVIFLKIFVTLRWIWEIITHKR